MGTSVTDVRRPEWRDEHALSRYPFVDNATLTADTGDFIPETAFLDASLHVIGAADRLRLTSITRSVDTAELVIGDAAVVRRASCTVDLADLPDVLMFYDDYGRAAGTLVTESERLSFLRTWSDGTRSFSPAATEFCVTCCVTVPDVGFRGFVLDDGSVFTGRILMVGERGIVLTGGESTYPAVDEVTGAVVAKACATITVNVVGDALFRRAACAGDEFTTPKFVRQILFKQGCREILATPDARGDIRIAASRQFSDDPSLRLERADGTVTLALTTASGCEG